MTPVLVDLGCGNIGSVVMAFERLGVAPLVSSDPETIGSAGHVVLPGVGSAGRAMRVIDEQGLGKLLRALKQPLLGICLGMQLLFERSEEQETECLGILPGSVRKLAPYPGLPVPHMGWSQVNVAPSAEGLLDGDYFYFAHSFACDRGASTIATVEREGPVTAAVRSGNIWGAQFHPERSGPAGARFLSAFLAA